ncbi:hypothetical protein VIGAN_03093700 [Vigna angularis var. angularis]|uniref:Uncharacterized protein n=1 Tax=Vigna angularis var. angularis TaxID=157739 RepID=A0A0S3RL04_PHAAN|nr:hypothetical protein VIGAN_03093700 [Vigna angularis var. angularis]
MSEEHTLYPTPANNLSSFSSSSNIFFPFPLPEHSPFTSLASPIPSHFVLLSGLQENKKTTKTEKLLLMLFFSWLSRS